MLNPHRHSRECGLGACLGSGPFALDTVIETAIRGSFWSLTFLREVGRGLEETSPGAFFQTKSINESSLHKLIFSCSVFWTLGGGGFCKWTL